MTPEVQESPQFQFLEVQLDYFLTPSNKINYTKYLLILAGKLLCISSAAYRMLRNSRVIILPRERLIRDLMSRSFQNNELQRLFKDLKPEQRFVNILFDEVKLIKTTRFSAGHIIGHANNAPSEQPFEPKLFAIKAGPRLIFAIYPVKNINSEEFRNMEVMKKSGVRPISFIYDNCPLYKTIAAFKALKKHGKSPGRDYRFITLVTDWFKMMNIKYRFGAINLRDLFRAPGTLNCDNFYKLLILCKVIGHVGGKVAKLGKKS